MKRKIGDITLRERREMCAVTDCGNCLLDDVCDVSILEAGYYPSDVSRDRFEKEVEWPEGNV